MTHNEEFLTDAGRTAKYARIELESLARRMHEGQRVRYSSVGEAGITAGVYDEGEVLDYAPETGLTLVLFDNYTEPSWMDGRLLHPVK